MKRVETSFETLKQDIKNYYDVNKHHFVTMNGVDLGNDVIEYQWFFSPYDDPSDILAFCTTANADVEVPSIAAIVPPAWVAEAELVDLLGVAIEGAKKGFVLEADFDRAPLRKQKK